MRPDRRLIATALSLALLALASCAPPPPKDGAIHLRYATPYPPNHPFSRADTAWMKKVEKDSGGRLKIDPYWGGATISSDQSVFELKHGVADIALVTPIYQRAGVRTIKAQTGFYVGADSPAQQIAVYHCLEKEFPSFTTEMAGVHVLAVQGGNLARFLTRHKPVTSLDDLHGLRLRAPTEVAVALRKFGANPSTMPMGEVYSALSKGTIDGVAAPFDTLASLHFSEVAKYMNTLKIARGGYPARAISDRAYNRLPADLKAVLDNSRGFWEAQLAQQVTKADATGLAFGKTHGITFVEPAPADQARFDAVENEVALEDATKLEKIGVEGPAIFRRAQAVIASFKAGSPDACTQP